MLRYTYIARVVFTNSLLLSWGEITFVRASEVAVPLQPLAHGVLQCLVIRVMVSSQTLFQRNKAMNMMLWGQIHCPSKSCDGLSCVAGRGRKEPSLLTRLTKTNIQPPRCFNIAVRIHCCPRRQEVHKRLQDIQSKRLRVIGNHPRHTPISHLHNFLNIHPIPILIHRLTAKFFAHRPSYPKPLVQQIGNYTAADRTNLYKTYQHKPRSIYCFN
jgi:hypothetical protein